MPTAGKAVLHMPTVTLYTQPGCHLCEAVEQVIRRVQGTHGFDLSIRSILDDPEDEARYHEAIPVVCVNGKEIARHRLTEADLEAALDAADARQ